MGPVGRGCFVQALGSHGAWERRVVVSMTRVESNTLFDPKSELEVGRSEAGFCFGSG